MTHPGSDEPPLLRGETKEFDEMLKYDPRLKQRAKELRNNSTDAEIMLWNNIKNRQLGVRFIRQKPIDSFIVDFYCRELSLVIEVDGEIHNFQRERDRERDDILKRNNLSVLRFTNSEVESDIGRVIAVIKGFIIPSREGWQQS